MPPKDESFTYEDEASSKGSTSTETTSDFYESHNNKEDGRHAQHTRSGRVVVVHFSSHPQTKLIGGLDQYSDEERHACWYSPEEKQSMHEECQKIATRMESGKSQRKNKPYRGLEQWTQDGLNRMHNHIYSVVDAVMDEQEWQWSYDVCDEFRIATKSQESSKACRDIARRAAIEDEQAVTDMLRQEKAEERESLLCCDSSTSSSSSSSNIDMIQTNVFVFGRCVLSGRRKQKQEHTQQQRGDNNTSDASDNKNVESTTTTTTASRKKKMKANANTTPIVRGNNKSVVSATDPPGFVLSTRRQRSTIMN